MKRFLKWFNNDQSAGPGFDAALAHLWFVTIHPFADGNGRIARAIRITRSWNAHRKLVLNRLLEGFEGRLTTSKYAKLAKCSPDTAARDIQLLLDYALLVRNPGGGRSTSYSLAPTAGTIDDCADSMSDIPDDRRGRVARG